MATTTSALVCRSAKFRAAALPPFSFLKTRTRLSSENALRAISAVRSDDPSSTTMMSRSAPSDESSERMVAQITFSSL